MVGYKQSLKENGSYLRKLRKPMIEKRRRERINASIEQLKNILIKSKSEIDYETKLDKAEILELTVNHLSKKQGTHVRADSYTQGFEDCSRETIRFLAATGTFDEATLTRLLEYLQSVSLNKRIKPTTSFRLEGQSHSYQRLCSTPQSQTTIPMMPSSVSMTTTPSMSQSYFHSFMSPISSEDSYGASSESENSILGNIISDEKPWRPW